MSKKKPVAPPPQLPRTGVESHAHLNGEEYENDLPQVLQRAQDAGIEYLGQVFLHPEAWRTGRALFKAYPWVFFMLGIHPTDAHDYSDQVLEGIGQAVAQDSRIKAIGEIGLDFYWDDCPPEIQRPAFVKQLALAKQLDLPVVIHSREVTEETYNTLEKHGFRNRPVLWHCFGGDTATARRIVEAGWHISIPGPITFPANQALRQAVADIPLDRLLVETDCPYLAPVPLRGKRNEPAYAAYTIEAMAKARNMDTAELWTICGNNAKRFFRLQA